MKRYIVPIEALGILGIENTEDAVTKLASDITITDEILVYKHIPYAALPLTDQQVSLLVMRGITPETDEYKSIGLLATDYEKTRTKWIKPQKRLQRGTGVKVAVLDTGCNIAHVPVDFAYNFIDSNTTITDVYGHGTQTTSIIRSSIGLAPGCIIHHLKAINDAGSTTSGAMIAAFDYCVTNNIDVINMSFTYDYPNQTMIDTCVANDIVCVAASGNSIVESFTLLPAGLNGVVAVNNIQEDGSERCRNYMAPPGGHGVDVSCAGYGSQIVNSNGTISSGNGTSFSAPFFVGTFAIYKEMLGAVTNYEALAFMKEKAFIKNNSDILKATLTF